MNSPQDLIIESSQGHNLAATYFSPIGSVKGAVLIGPATGITRQFYKHFSSYLASAGYGVLTFDNYGIGGSLATSITACDASLISWGEHDL